jgi:hypothetical protein
MMPWRAGSGVLVVALLLGCSSPPPERAFRATLDGVPLKFDFEVQDLHRNATVRIRNIPEGQGPSERMMGLQPGSETVVWLYHYEDDGSPLVDEDRAFSVAISLRNAEPGRLLFPTDRASAIFFCHNWGQGFRSAEARAREGWLVIREATDRAVSGEFDILFEGTKERRDWTFEPLRVRLEGRFSAIR